MTTNEELRNENRRVEISVDPRLLQTIGRSLYKGHPIPILIRELVQNAVDAHIRDDSVPDIDVTIQMDGAGEPIMISVRDKGIGMSADDLHNNFLRLGASDKGSVSDKSVGGFGIAKAAIMSHPFWAVHTRDNYVDYDMLLEHELYSKREEIKGTLVTIRLDCCWGYYDKRTAMMMLLLSNLEGVNLIFLNNDGKETTRIENIGIHNLKAIAVVEDWSDTVKETLAENLQMITLQDVDYRLNDRISMEIKGLTVVRIKGLVQYIKRNYGYRKTNLIFDLLSVETPDSDDYPLTISREGIKGKLGEFITTEVNLADVNAISADDKIKTPVKSSIDQIEGYFICGIGELAGPTLERVSNYTETEMREAYSELSETLEKRDVPMRMIEEKPNSLIVIDGSLYADVSGKMVKISDGRNTARFVAAAKNVWKLRPTDFDISVQNVMKKSAAKYDKIATVIMHYANKDKAVAMRHAKMLAVWEQIVQLVADKDDYFGIGVIGDSWIRAVRMVHNGSVYYLLNPRGIYDECDTREGIVLRLWLLACHETCHKEHSSHDETLTSAIDGRVQSTADRMYYNLRYLAEELK